MIAEGIRAFSRSRTAVSATEAESKAATTISVMKSPCACLRQNAGEGAAIVDIGGESTRPGSDGVTLDEELRRVVPVLERLQGEVAVSIDTAKAEVARRALDLGAEMVNDVTAFRSDPALAEVCAAHDAYVCLMHMQGEPRTMQLDPRYDDVATEVAAFLEERMAFAVANGVREERICLDGKMQRQTDFDVGSECVRVRARRQRRHRGKRLVLKCICERYADFQSGHDRLRLGQTDKNKRV